MLCGICVVCDVFGARLAIAGNEVQNIFLM